MEFIGSLLSVLDMDMQKVIQLVYIVILIWMLTIYVPKREKQNLHQEAIGLRFTRQQSRRKPGKSTIERHKS